MMLRFAVLSLTLLTLSNLEAIHIPSENGLNEYALIDSLANSGEGASVKNSGFRNHSYTLGFHLPDDSKIFETVARSEKSDANLFSFDLSKMEIKYPNETQSNDKRINMIEVVDLKANGYGGYVYVKLFTGLGFKTVTFSIEPQRKNPFEFILRVFGIPTPFKSENES